MKSLTKMIKCMSSVYIKSQTDTLLVELIQVNLKTFLSHDSFLKGPKIVCSIDINYPENINPGGTIF